MATNKDIANDSKAAAFRLELIEAHRKHKNELHQASQVDFEKRKQGVDQYIQEMKDDIIEAIKTQGCFIVPPSPLMRQWHTVPLLIDYIKQKYMLIFAYDSSEMAYVFKFDTEK